MELKDILVKCNPETESFIKKYIMFMYTITNGGKIKEECGVPIAGNTYNDKKRCCRY